MSVELIKRLVVFVLLCAVQVLVLNHIHLFGYATPLVYVYFAISFQRGTPRWAALLWSFSLGLIIDIFSNTPGLAAGAMTLIGFVQPMLLEVFLPRDAADNMPVSPMSMGYGKYLSFVVILTLAYCMLFFAVESFSVFDWLHWLICAASSALLTVLVVVAVQSMDSSEKPS